MRRYTAILVSVSVLTVGAHAQGSDFTTSTLDIRDLPLPAYTQADVDQVRPAIDPARMTHAFTDVSFRISTVSPTGVSASAFKHGSALDEIEDALAGKPGGSQGFSNQLGASGTSVGLHPHGQNTVPLNESFTKTTVIPLPTSGMLGVAGLALIGFGPSRRRR
jgi:hypothetical protein